jgi:hypothetical protein
MSGSLRGSVCVFLAVATLCAPCLRGQSAGVPPEWEVRKDLASIAEQTGRLRPLLDAVKPEQWAEKGAPDAYVAQWRSVMAESDYLVRTTKELAAEPERLTLALETYLRLQSLDALLGSLNEGIRKYQNPALADLIQGAMSDGAAGRDKLRQYVVQLAAVKEQQLRVADQEAQRCRGTLLKQAPAQRDRGKKADTK